MTFRQRPTYATRRRYSRNKLLVQKNAIQLVNLLASIVALILKIAAGTLWVLKVVLSVCVRIGVRYAILPAYRRAKQLSHHAKQARSYLRQQFGENLSRSIIIYGGLSVLALFATATNLKARELRPEEVGKNSSLYALLAYESDFELIVEESAAENTANSGAEPQKSETLAYSDTGVASQVAPTGNMPEEIDNAYYAESEGALVRPNLPATDTTPQLRDSIITYVVQDGDTISEIAEKFNISTNTILWENKVGPRDFIKPGQELVILQVTGVTYTVKRGDTLSAIAAKYKAKAEDILEVNKLADASELNVGATVVIPDGIPPPPPRPAYTSSAGLADLSNIFKPAPAVAGKFNWPTTNHRITQYFRGWRHTGLDIGVSKGEPIYAADDGVVITSGWNSGGYGLYIIIDHGNGIHTLYGHNSKLLVSKGDRVKKGEVVAQSGSTGRSTGPHLHFEVRVNGNRVNPLDYL